MIGSNDFKFNQATMMEIVQYWIDSKLPAINVKVEAVNAEDQYSFIIRVKSEEQPK